MDVAVLGLMAVLVAALLGMAVVDGVRSARRRPDADEPPRFGRLRLVVDPAVVLGDLDAALAVLGPGGEVVGDGEGVRRLAARLLGISPGTLAVPDAGSSSVVDDGVLVSWNVDAPNVNGSRTGSAPAAG